jgi:hypothetical protein
VNARGADFAAGGHAGLGDVPAFELPPVVVTAPAQQTQYRTSLSSFTVGRGQSTCSHAILGPRGSMGSGDEEAFFEDFRLPHPAGDFQWSMRKDFRHLVKRHH